MYKPRYSSRQIYEVTQTDMINFLSSSYGFHFRKKGNGYTCIEHSSLFINSNRRLWYWNSKGVGGDDVFAWNQKIESKGFKDTMIQVLGRVYEDSYIADETDYSHRNNTTSNEYTPPPPKTQSKYSNVFAYLVKTRCISSDIVSTLIKDNRLYQDEQRNAVFLNLDENNNVRFWCLRGTNTEKKFTKNAPGSDNEYYGFTLDYNPNSDTLYVFEAPIDLLSHCTIADIKNNQKGSWKEQNRIALLGVNDHALECYLKKHANIKTIKFCLDNDETGITATSKYEKKYYELGYRTEHIYYSSPGKDLNEILCNYQHKKQEKELPQKKEAPHRETLSTSAKKNQSEKAVKVSSYSKDM